MTSVEAPREVRSKPKNRWWPWLLVVCVAGSAAWLYPRFTKTTEAAPVAAPKGPGGRGAARQVPVVAAAARRGDMPVYLNGLGSVTAFNTVTVKSRVDGELVRVAFTEGDFVKQGDLLAEIDPRPFEVQLSLAEAQKARDEALLSNARLDLERYKTLMEQNAVPKQQLDTQVSTVAQFESTVKADQAQIDNVKLQLVYSRITSPLTGRIGLRLVDRGNIVHATDTNGLAVVAQLQPIAVLFNIAEDSLPQVSAKMRAGVKLPVIAFDRDLKKKLASGTLLTIDNQIDQASGTVRFKAQFANDDLSLFPNQFVNARLLLDTKHDAVIIPTAAIQHSPSSAFVYRVKDDKSVEVREISSTLSEGDESAVDKGLEAGDVVVIDGIDKLERGTKVVVRMAGAAPPAAAPGRSGRGPARGTVPEK
ncbi:MAG TPA: MdtA/MuxA family multidrug efflux RND transporter periplasmic adaptor subunit [Bryobacteraceae bacterium]|jgi:multidrug efflux system membrane fusion protein|nr:MdtA/MuxA family multidrug efflux RND transporter periplasmic adaptor subunit [Bryobacteraceae bacterium]